MSGSARRKIISGIPSNPNLPRLGKRRSITSCRRKPPPHQTKNARLTGTGSSKSSPNSSPSSISSIVTPCPPFLPPLSALRLPFSILMLSGTPTFPGSVPIPPWGRGRDRGFCTLVAPALRRLSQQSRSLPRRLARHPAWRNSRPRRTKWLRQKHSLSCHPALAPLERRHRPRQSSFQRGRSLREIGIADALAPRPRNQHRSSESADFPQSRSSHRIPSQRSLARSRHRHERRMRHCHPRRTPTPSAPLSIPTRTASPPPPLASPFRRPRPLPLRPTPP